MAVVREKNRSHCLIPRAGILDNRLSPGARCAWMNFISEDDTFSCSLETMCDNMKISRKTMLRYFRELVTLHYAIKILYSEIPMRAVLNDYAVFTQPASSVEKKAYVREFQREYPNRKVISFA